MKTLTKKDSFIALGTYLAITVVAFISNFAFDNFRFTTLAFYLIVGAAVLIFNKIFTDKKTANILVGASLTACVCFNFFYDIIMDSVGTADRIKSLAALVLFIITLFLIYSKKLVFSAPIPVLMLFLNERLSAATAVILFCCALISLFTSNKKTVGILLCVWFAAVTVGVYIYAFVYSDTYFNYADNINLILSENKNWFALAAAEIITLVLAFKNNCKSKTLLTVSYAVIIAMNIVGCLHFKIGFLNFLFFALAASILCAMVYDKQLYKSACEFVKNNKAVSIIIFLLALT